MQNKEAGNAARVMMNAALNNAGAAAGPMDTAALRRLSPAQQRVLACLVQGWQRKEIAAEMRLSERGVDYHCSVIFRVLRVETNVDAVRVAIEGGFGGLE